MAESAAFSLPPSQGSLKPVTEIGSVVRHVLLAIQQVPGVAPLITFALSPPVWLARRTAGIRGASVRQ